MTTNSEYWSSNIMNSIVLPIANFLYKKIQYIICKQNTYIHLMGFVCTHWCVTINVRTLSDLPKFVRLSLNPILPVQGYILPCLVLRPNKSESMKQENFKNSYSTTWVFWLSSRLWSIPFLSKTNSKTFPVEQGLVTRWPEMTAFLRPAEIERKKFSWWTI